MYIWIYLESIVYYAFHFVSFHLIYLLLYISVTVVDDQDDVVVAVAVVIASYINNIDHFLRYISLKFVIEFNYFCSIVQHQK